MSDSSPPLSSQAASEGPHVVTTEDILDCFDIFPSKEKITVSRNTIVHITYRQRTRGTSANTSKQTCTLAIKAPLEFHLHVEFLEQTCVRGPTSHVFTIRGRPPSLPNYVKLSGNGFKSYWSGCESWWNTVHEFFSRSNAVAIQITRREWTSPYTVKMRVRVAKNLPWVDVRHLTRHLGKSVLLCLRFKHACTALFTAQTHSICAVYSA